MASERMTIPATPRTPEIDFDFASGRLALRGESYPDDVATLFGPVVAALREHLAEPSDAPLHVDIELVYFNSSSAKVLMTIFQLLEEAARQGRPVTVDWYCDPDDETMREFGEDFSEDLEHVTFSVREAADRDP
ncbi:MAG TPA: DUF1987 domain-containing protein [Azospirillum sp.]|nr:DUF1987 domain-containing protein [Azospirillum sp.]